MTSLSPDRANTLKSAFRICNVEPLKGEDIDRYYIDLSEVRNTEAIEGINTIFDNLDRMPPPIADRLFFYSIY